MAEDRTEILREVEEDRGVFFEGPRALDLLAKDPVLLDVTGEVAFCESFGFVGFEKDFLEEFFEILVFLPDVLIVDEALVDFGLVDDLTAFFFGAISASFRVGNQY